MKLAGVVPYTVEIEPGTKMNFWIPKETLKKSKKSDKNSKVEPKKPTKPAILFIHGFAAEGIPKNTQIYIPDLLFFGGSYSDKPDRSPSFQAHCLVKSLRILGVEEFVLVGFSYGGMVAFKIVEEYPEMVRAMVVSGSVLAMTDTISESNLNRIGFKSSADLLLPTSVKGLKTLFALSVHRPMWFPNRLFKDFIEVMDTNRKEKAELLEGLVTSSNEDVTIPRLQQNSIQEDSDKKYQLFST
ncbi:hypothetical protein Bca52824_034817 [Brassica carinata]|uniref:AB hydrolase-1 domain-containing protein n=1 Tax=Brassica carinata TaxID=52824 RepID=A0A8X7S404_BRACI|nr:hypothetical protein Bca52824_034817 [Brassica carinata]